MMKVYQGNGETEPVKEETKREVKNFGVGSLVQAPYLNDKGDHILYLDFGFGTKFFVSVQNGMDGSFARVGDRFNVTGFIQNPTLIMATHVQQQL